MAVPTNTLVESAIDSKREDLMNIIYDISPTDTPFVSNVGRSDATAALHEWSVD